MIRYDLSGLDILLVDDSRYMLQLLQMILRSMGVNSVRCVHNPRNAVSEVAAFSPHLVITDLLMEPTDGLDLIKSVRQEKEPLCFTPILVLSGFTDKDHVLEASHAGANYVLAKPISAEMLHRRIVSLIEESPAFVRNGSGVIPQRRTAA